MLGIQNKGRHVSTCLKFYQKKSKLNDAAQFKSLIETIPPPGEFGDERCRQEDKTTRKTHRGESFGLQGEGLL